MDIQKVLAEARVKAFFIAGVPARDRDANDPLAMQALLDLEFFLQLSRENSNPTVHAGTITDDSIIFSLMWIKHPRIITVSFFGARKASVQVVELPDVEKFKLENTPIARAAGITGRMLHMAENQAIHKSQ